MTTRTDAYIPTNQTIHSCNQIKDFRLRLSETNETIHHARDRAGEHGVHRNLLRYDIQLDTHLVLGEAHVDKDVSDEDEHDPQHCEGKGFSIVMEVLCDVHII